jgi:hypothetical protein
MFLSITSKTVVAADEQVAGLYKAVLLHEGSNFYQFAKITFRTVNVGGQIKISANARVFFGDWDSNEYMTYEYPDVSLNLLTRQLNIKTDTNDVSLQGFLRTGVIEGEWFSTIVGRVGTFKALKVGVPEIPVNAELVKSLSGYYRGALKNTNPQSNLPERVTMSFVTTQDISTGAPVIKISGNARFYLGGYDSLEYIETPFSNVQFNFYSRYLTAKTQDYGITFKGILTPSGRFDGVVLSDGLGDVGTTEVNRFP